MAETAAAQGGQGRPRRPKDEGFFPDDTEELMRRYSERHGLSRAATIRLLVTKGLEREGLLSPFNSPAAA